MGSPSDDLLNELFVIATFPLRKDGALLAPDESEEAAVQKLKFFQAFVDTGVQCLVSLIEEKKGGSSPGLSLEESLPIVADAFLSRAKSIIALLFATVGARRPPHTPACEGKVAQPAISRLACSASADTGRIRSAFVVDNFDLQHADLWDYTVPILPQVKFRSRHSIIQIPSDRRALASDDSSGDGAERELAQPGEADQDLLRKFSSVTVGDVNEIEDPLADRSWHEGPRHLMRYERIQRRRPTGYPYAMKLTSQELARRMHTQQS